MVSTESLHFDETWKNGSNVRKEDSCAQRKLSDPNAWRSRLSSVTIGVDDSMTGIKLGSGSVIGSII